MAKAKTKTGSKAKSSDTGKTKAHHKSKSKAAPKGSKTKPAAKSDGKRKAKSTSDKRWVSKVKTVSTFPPAGTFDQDAETIAKVMASKKVSPKGLGSAVRMVQYFINRGGKGLSAARKRELEKAKHLLQQKSHAGGSRSK